jgi:hypothetical protein
VVFFYRLAHSQLCGCSDLSRNLCLSSDQWYFSLNSRLFPDKEKKGPDSKKDKPFDFVEVSVKGNQMPPLNVPLS